MKKDDLIVYKPNELIEVISRPISVVGLKAYNSILKRFQEEKKPSIIISPKDVLTEIGSSDSYEELYNYLDELQKTQVKSIDKRGKLWGGFVLISEFKKVNGGISVAIPPTIYNALCSNEKKEKDLYYTAIKLLEQKSFKCSYSLVFYEIFKRYENVEIPIYSIEDLKKLTKTTDTYKLFADFKRRVLLPAIKEVNKYESKYVYSHIEFKIGRKVDKIKFTKTLKGLEEPQLSLSSTSSKSISSKELSEKLLSAIEKAKKNIHIARKFSKRAINNAVKQYGEEIVIAGLEKMSSYNEPIYKFSNFLTFTLSELKKEKEVKEISKSKIKKEEIITPAPVVKKIQKTKLNELDQLKSDICNQARKQLGATEVLLNLFNEIVVTSSKEEVLLLIKKYDLEINLNLFSKN